MKLHFRGELTNSSAKRRTGGHKSLELTFNSSSNLVNETGKSASACAPGSPPSGKLQSSTTAELHSFVSIAYGANHTEADRFIADRRTSRSCPSASAYFDTSRCRATNKSEKSSEMPIACIRKTFSSDAVNSDEQNCICCSSKWPSSSNRDDRSSALASQWPRARAAAVLERCFAHVAVLEHP